MAHILAFSNEQEGTSSNRRVVYRPMSRKTITTTAPTARLINLSLPWNTGYLQTSQSKDNPSSAYPARIPFTITQPSARRPSTTASSSSAERSFAHHCFVPAAALPLDACIISKLTPNYANYSPLFSGKCGVFTPLCQKVEIRIPCFMVKQQTKGQPYENATGHLLCTDRFCRVC